MPKAGGLVARVGGGVWGNGLAYKRKYKVSDGTVKIFLYCAVAYLYIYVYRLTHTPYITSGQSWTLDNVGLTMSFMTSWK